MNFRQWWKDEKLRPPYTNPERIAKAAWDAAVVQCLHQVEQIECVNAPAACAIRRDVALGAINCKEGG